MSRYTRGREPYAPKVDRVELPEGHVKLRAILFGAAILLAVIAFGVGLNSLLMPQTGWQTIEAAERTPAAQEISLQYRLGEGEKGIAAERKLVSQVYTRALSQADAQLGALSGDTVNLYALSTHPNETVTVGDVLYQALEDYLATGSRAIYFGPLYSYYNAFFAAQNDEDAAMYDPARNPGAADFVSEITAFATDPAQIGLVLLGENQVRLRVSESYLAYARENELETLLDFGFVKNAFLIDAVADALEEAGLTGALLTSSDGFSRSLCEDTLGVNLLERMGEAYRQAATGSYAGPASVAALRAFPAGDEARFYTYADGTVCAPVLDEATGLLTAQNDNLILFGQGSAGVLALQAMRALSTWELDGLNCLYSRDGVVYCTDPAVAVSELFEGVPLESGN